MLAVGGNRRVTEIHECVSRKSMNLPGGCSQRGPCSATISTVGLRVLVVDDHAGFRQLARRLLMTGGYEVIGLAADGAEAVRQAALLRPDLVLLDVLLPDLDGFGVAEQLAAFTDPPVVVLVSSRTRVELGARLNTAPVRGFLRKDELTLQRLAELIR
jgi:CheY-like chemotaxis protein